MRIIRDTAEFRKIEKSVCLAAGFFDGVHLGHRKVLSAAIESARACGGEAWILTFDRQPISVLAPSKAPLLLNAPEDRLMMFEALGMDGALLLPFTRNLAVQDPEEFVRSLTSGHLTEVRCGDNWRFGRQATGTPVMLAELGKKYGFHVGVVPYAEYEGTKISSTRIRTAVSEGRLDTAAAMLGRRFFIRDEVVHGRGEGGPVLGRATANIRLRGDIVLPPPGVYAAEVTVSEGTFPAAVNLGKCPTFGEDGTTALEAHLLDFDGDLYGQTATVTFWKRLRDERRFESPAALSAQIAQDELAVRRLVRH